MRGEGLPFISDNILDRPNLFPDKPYNRVFDFDSRWGIEGKQKVSSWTDKIKGINLTQKTASIRPDYIFWDGTGSERIPGVSFSGTYLQWTGRISELEGLKKFTQIMISGGVVPGPYAYNLGGGSWSYQCFNKYTSKSIVTSVENDNTLYQIQRTSANDTYSSVNTLGSQIAVYATTIDLTQSSNLNKVRGFVNGNLITRTTNNTAATSTFQLNIGGEITELIFGAKSTAGAYSTASFDGTIFRVITYDRQLSDTEVKAESLRLRGEYNILNKRQIIGWGDSLMGGNASLPNNIPRNMELGIGNLIAYNCAKGGSTTTDWNAGLLTSVTDAVNMFQHQTVVSIIGTNDLESTGTQAAIYARLSTAVTTLRTAGIKRIILSTMLPKNSANPTFEADRQAFNVLVLANTAGADAIADIGSDANIGQAGQQTGVNYAGDGVHLNQLGSAIASSLYFIPAYNSINVP